MNLVAGAKEKPTAIRLPADLKKAIDQAAKRNGRSRNSEVIVRLADSFGLRDDHGREGENS